MRRRRSETIDAENFDEFLRISKNPQLANHRRPRKSLPDSCLLSLPCGRTSSNILPQSLQPFHMDKNSFGKQKQVEISPTANYWEDMDFESPSEPSTQHSLNTAGTRISGLEIEDQEKDYEINTVKIMVIGAKSSGRHLLLHSAFDDQELNKDMPEYHNRGPMDLVVMKTQGIGYLNVFKFWVKEAGRQEYRQLFNTYYRSVAMYVFVYQVGDRNSFECLEQAIQEAQAEAGIERFEGILVGGLPNELRREVGAEEGQNLANKYNLAGFVETDFEQSEDIKGLLQALFPSR